jgi:hypothetical protein
MGAYAPLHVIALSQEMLGVALANENLLLSWGVLPSPRLKLIRS